MTIYANPAWSGPTDGWGPDPYTHSAWIARAASRLHALDQLIAAGYGNMPVEGGGCTEPGGGIVPTTQTAREMAARLRTVVSGSPPPVPPAPRSWMVHSGGTCELLQDNFTGPVLLLAPTVLLPLLAHALGAGWPAALLIGLPIGAAISFGVLVVGIGCAGG